MVRNSDASPLGLALNASHVAQAGRNVGGGSKERDGASEKRLKRKQEAGNIQYSINKDLKAPYIQHNVQRVITALNRT